MAEDLKSMGEKERILIVDDNEVICKTMKNIFQAKNYFVETVHSGKDAITANKKQHYNVAILDLKLPDMDGLAVLSQLYKENADIGIIMITGFASIETAVGALTKGAEAFIVKPLNMDEVLNTVNRVIEKQRLMGEKQQIEERYRILYKKLSDAMFLSDKNGNVLLSNDKAVELFGYNSDELLGMHFTKLLHPDDRKRLQDSRSKSLELGEAAIEGFEANARRKDGSYFDVHITNTILYDENKPSGYQSLIRDITERKRAERKLRESEQRHRMVLSSMNDLIFILNNKNEYVEVYVSDNRDLYNTREDHQGKNVTDILPPDVALKITEGANRVRESGKREELEYSLIIDNEKNWYSAMLEIHQDGESIVQTVRNITLRKAAEKELKNRENELEIYSSLLQHDLSNDLGVIFGNIDIARLLLSEGENDELIETIDSIEAICNRMESLITMFSRPIDSVEKVLIKQLKSIVARTNAVNPNLTINIHAKGAWENLTVPASRLLVMVWENLIRNAAEHAGENSIIDIQISREENTVHVIFSDNGPGVSEKIRKKLFQKGVTIQDGGFGLYLSKQIIQSIGGSIELVTGKSVQGAKFKIILPIIPE